MLQRAKEQIFAWDLAGERKKAKNHNIKQHEAMQRSSGCEESSDGTSSKPDCRDDDTCTVFEFGPQSTKLRHRLQSLAKKLAYKATKALKDKTSAKIKRCFIAGLAKGRLGLAAGRLAGRNHATRRCIHRWW